LCNWQIFAIFASKKRKSMNQNHLKVNRSFMLMNAVLAFALFAIVLLFLYISFRFQRQANRRESFAETYQISVAPQLAGDSLSVYLNDSLLLRTTVPASGLQDTVRRWERDNALLVVAHSDSDRIVPFTLPDEGASVSIKRDGDGALVVVKD
jgi:hypothetical protein